MTGDPTHIAETAAHRITDLSWDKYLGWYWRCACNLGGGYETRAEAEAGASAHIDGSVCSPKPPNLENKVPEFDGSDAL